MRKAERLFQILTLMRGRRTAITGQQLSEALEVSTRTIYRDINALMCSGVPIEGEAGVGYFLQAGYHLPPLMFSAEESLALLLGSKMVQAWTDPELAKAADSASTKILSVLPESLLTQVSNLPYEVPSFDGTLDNRVTHGVLRNACESHYKIIIHYSDKEGQLTRRCLWPLGLVFWGERWTLTAWCESRDDYRHFRLDRIKNIQTLDTHYPFHAERNLKHVMKLIQQKHG